jgi:hypothetical protein
MLFKLVSLAAAAHKEAVLVAGHEAAAAPVAREETIAVAEPLACELVQPRGSH